MNVDLMSLKVASEITGEDYTEEPQLSEEQIFENSLAEIGKVAGNAIPVFPTIKDRFIKEFDKAKSVAELLYPDWSECFESYKQVGSIDDFKEKGFAQVNFTRMIVNSLIDNTYMQNPHTELTSLDTEGTDMGEAIQIAIDNLTKKYGKNRLNLKPNILRAILYALFTNLGIVRLHYQNEEESIDTIRDKYNTTMLKLREEKDFDKAAKLYQSLELLNNKLVFAQEFGIRLEHVSPFNFFCDVDTTQADLSDATIVFEREYINEDMIKADYLIYNTDENCYYYKHSPDVKYDASNYTPIEFSEESLKASIVEDIMKDETEVQGKLKRENKTPCIWIFDKITKLVYLYREDNFDNPLWVFEDELALSRFFHHFVLNLSSTFSSIYQVGELSFMIPQQQVINDSIRQKQIIKNTSFNNFIYDSNAIEETEISKLFTNVEKGRNSTLTGIKVKARVQDLDKVIKPFMLPIASMPDLLRTEQEEENIYRISRTTKAMTGGEYKTNTTNQALDKYQNFQDSRSATIIDKIEDFVEQIMWSTIEIVVSKYSKEKLQYLIPASKLQQFQTMSVEELNRMFSFSIASGSIEKSTSESKKKEAMMLMQVLGQFGTGMPMTVMSLVLKLMENLVTAGTITKDDFDRLKKEGEAVMQKGISTPQASEQQPAPTT